MVIKPNSV